jgi:hypothetical protein
VTSLILWTIVPLIALHLWMWRRARAIFGFQLVLDIVLAVVIGPALVTGDDLNPVRCLERNRPFTEYQWSESTTFQPTQSDLVLQFHPWWAAAREQLLEGRLPLIADEIGGGLPLLANGQTGLMAPVMIPVWVLGPERGTTVMALWKLELAGLGAFLLFFKRWRLRWASATLGGVAYAGGAYQVAWLLVPLSWVTAALPWVWWVFQDTVRRRATWRSWVLAGVLAGWLLGSGLHPETAVVVIGSAAMVALILHPRRWHRVVAAIAVAAVVAVLLSWPTIAYISSSARMEQTREVRPNTAPVPAGWRGLAVRQMMVPAINGQPGRGDWQAPFSYAPAATGVGGAVLGILVLGRVRRRHRRLLWGAVGCLGLAALLYLRLPPLDALLVRVPPLDRMTLPRFAALVPWGLALWAALAADGVARGRFRSRYWIPIACVVPAICISFFADDDLGSASKALMAVTMLALLATVYLVRRPRALAVVVAIELSLYAVGINPVAAVEDRLPKPELVARLERLQTAEGGRVMGLDGVLPSNLSSRYGLSDLRAYDPLRPVPYAQFMAALGQRAPVLGGALRTAPPALCGAWSVRFLVATADDNVPGWERVWTDGDVALWRNPRWLPEIRVVGRTVTGGWDLLRSDSIDFASAAMVPADTTTVNAETVDLEIIATEGSRMELVTRCDGPCLVLAARPWAPGWRVRIDGEASDLVLANLAGLGAVVPDGEHRVVFSYHPWAVSALR